MWHSNRPWIFLNATQGHKWTFQNSTCCVPLLNEVAVPSGIQHFDFSRYKTKNRLVNENPLDGLAWEANTGNQDKIIDLDLRSVSVIWKETKDFGGTLIKSLVGPIGSITGLNLSYGSINLGASQEVRCRLL